MRPLLRAGKTVDVDAVSPDALSSGDIILYRAADRQLMHRIGLRVREAFWVFDDAAVVGWHKVPARELRGRLRHPSPFSRGLLGLVFGLIAFIVFKTGRCVRDFL